MELNIDFNPARILETLPTIGTSLIGIFGVIGFIILSVYLLNKLSDVIDSRKSKDAENDN